MESQLKDRHCKPCEKGSPALDSATTRLLLTEVPGWSLRTESGQPAKLTRGYEFADFSAAMAFVDKNRRHRRGGAAPPRFLRTLQPRGRYRLDPHCERALR